jgi:hypothetical protein
MVSFLVRSPPVALLALFLVGCRGVLGIEPLPGIRADAGAADRDVPDATRDAPVEAAPTDATTEATPDAGPTFCSTVPSPPPGHHVLCSDFDEAQDGFESGWDNADQDPDPGDINGGVLATDAKLHWSAPRSLLATTPETVSSTADVSAILLKTIPGSGSSVLGSLVLEFELYVEELDIPSSGPSSGYILVSSVDYGVGGVILYLDSAGLEFEIAPQLDVVHHVLVPFPTGQWVKVTLLIEDAPTDGGPDGWAYVDCAGNDANSTLPAAFQQVSGDLRVTLGSSAIGPVGAFKANYDDVVLGWGPP